MEQRLITDENGAKTYVEIDDRGVITRVHTRRDAGALIDSNRTQRNSHQRGSLIGNTQRHYEEVANIPTFLYLELCEKFGPPRENQRAWKKWLNDYDNRYFRTSQGTV